MSFCQAALALADRGFRAFPLLPGGKLPAIEAFPERATTDPETLASWWVDDVMGWEHDFNVGISTNGLCVIDVDVKDGRNGEESLLRLEMEGLDLPATYEQRTPTGGRHLVFRAAKPVANSVQKIGPGLDVRGEGGFIVGSGSTTPKGTYTDNGLPVAEAPAELLLRCGFHVPRAELVDGAAPAVDEDRAAERFEEWLKTAPRSVKGDGGDACAFNTACKGRDFGCGASTVLDLMLSEAWDDGCGWTADRLQEKVAHAFKYAKGAAGNASAEVQFHGLELVVPAPVPASAAAPKGTVKEKSQVTQLIEIGLSAELFCDRFGDAKPYASVEVNGHTETMLAEGSAFRDYIAASYFAGSGKGAGRAALADAQTTLAAYAKASARRHPVYLRVGKDSAGNIVLDDGSAAHGAYVITPRGWSHRAAAPVRFRRPATMREYPRPAASDFARLWRHVNVREQDQPLIAGFMLAALNPDGPYPPLLMTGEQGSGKTANTRAIKALIDPAGGSVRAARDVSSLIVTASHGWLVTADNTSGVTPEMSDLICVFATGGGFTDRKLYTDNDECLIELQRPVILNGIDEIASRPDLGERAIHCEVPRLETRQTEADLGSAFVGDGPHIFGALLDGVSLALADFRDIDIGPLPRMADFAKWAAAGMPALGFTADQFVEAYRSNQSQGASAGLEASAVAQAVEDFLESHAGHWLGSSVDLLRQLGYTVGEYERRLQAWPKSAKGLINALRRIAPALRGRGIELRHFRGRDGRFIELNREAAL